MLHPHEIKVTKLRATLNKLIKQHPDPESSEYIALVQLINELSVLGFPIFVKAVEGVLNTKGVQKFISPVLRAVLKRTGAGVQGDGPKIKQVYATPEEEHLLSQLKELIDEIKLIHAFSDLSDIERLRSSLWIVATSWLLKKAHDERNERLRRLLINASDQMGVSLSVNAELYEANCFNILSGVLRDCHLAGGELDLDNLNDLTRYFSDDLRGIDQIESLSLPNDGLSYLLKKRIHGIDCVQSIEINGISDLDIDLLNEHSDQEYVQGIVESLVKGAQAKQENSWVYPVEILEKITGSNYKNELMFLVKRVSHQVYYELDKVSFNLKYIPQPDHSFWMMETQVTQALYRTVSGESPSRFKGEQLPVEEVSWADGIAFCNELSKKLGLTPAYKGTGNMCELINGANGFRLPSEAEWEFAAKGGQNFVYAGSDKIDEVAWYRDNSSRETHEVAKKKPNGYGLYDMSGNVWEWCADDYTNPGQHSPGASRRASRGGGWSDDADDCMVSHRFRFSPVSRFGILGLRLSRSLG